MAEASPAARRLMTLAPASGTEPTAVRTMPMASRTRMASRTEGRETPSSSARGALGREALPDGTQAGGEVSLDPGEDSFVGAHRGSVWPR